MYRLAVLLTGNPKLAAGVITAVVDAQPDLRKLDNQHMDRLTVLRSREIRPGVLIDQPHVPREVAEALSQLPLQQREAWVFARVYRMELRDLARAMDCSVTATQRHLELADEATAGALGVPAAAKAPAQLLQYTMHLDVPAFYRAAQRTRRMLRWLIVGIIIAILLTAILVGSRLASSDREGEDDRNAINDRGFTMLWYDGTPIE